jgi:ABC-2 type transport system ATP-binding protein
VGYLPEHLQIPAHQTARTALDYYGRLSGLSSAQIRQRRGELIELVGLAGRDRESVKRFSKGMLQRLGLAQALLHNPAVLILDEPTDGLDPVGRSQVRNILQQLRDEGRTVFLNSHLLQEVELFCDRVAILDQGHLRCVGRIDELTPPQENELQMDLVGAEAQIRQGIGSRTITLWQPVDQGRFRVHMPINSQPDADGIVDELRRDGVSIRGISWRRKTLEDAFLEVVARTPEIQ